MGRKGLPVLYSALRDAHREVRANVAAGINVIGADEQGIPYLIESLGDEGPEIRESARRSLAALGAKAIPALTQALKHESKAIRENAVGVLRMMGSGAARALPNLLDVLCAPEFKDERWVVVEAIANLGSLAKDAGPRLIQVWDKEPEIECMAEALGKIGATEAVDPLLKRLFAVPRSKDRVEDFKKALFALASDRSLPKEVLEWAVRASTYEHKGERHGGGWYEAGYITLQDSDEAIRCLCDINTPAVDNLLHLIAEKKDISVTMDTGCSERWQEKVSFENQRKQAVSELKKRGNSTYRPKAYYEISEVEAQKLVTQVRTAQQKERERRYQFLLSFVKRQSTGYVSAREEKDKAAYLEELVNNYKTAEVLRLLASDLVGECDIHSDYGIYGIVRRLVAIGRELRGQEARSTLSNVLRHLTKQLAGTHTISPGGLHSFEAAFVELGRELTHEDVISALAVIKSPWPGSYKEVIERLNKGKTS